MNGNTYAIFKDAIIKKLQVTCTYNEYYREMCPHVIGTKNGKAQVLSYQFAGESSSGLPPGGEWRCMEVELISDAESQPGDWHTGPSHTQPQTCVDDVDVEVAY